jgi:hypothetical protein
MKPKGSLSCSQKPSTDPYPEPDQSSPYHPILYIFLLSYHLVQDFLAVSFLLDFNQTPVCIPLLMGATCPAHLILHNWRILIIFGEEFPH